MKIKTGIEEAIQKLIDSFSAKISNPRGECFEASGDGCTR